MAAAIVRGMPEKPENAPHEKPSFETTWFPYQQFHVPEKRQLFHGVWRTGRFEFRFPRPVMLMGIVNVTPDSFSDGGKFLDPSAAVARAHELVRQGAEIIDVGGESTRPGAEPVGEAEELRRVVPVVERLALEVEVPLSIDTRKAAVAKQALQAGASIVNDVGANREEDGIWRLVAESGAGYICMHMRGTPQTMQADPIYEDVVTEVKTFWTDRLERLGQAGISEDQVVLDPGLGFGKAVEHNLQLLAAWPRLTKLKRPLLLGVSRKSFMGRLLGADVNSRLPASLACSCWAVQSGVQLIRTHDVAETLQAVRMTEAILNQTK
jgi:dihydropteroate synthase